MVVSQNITNSRYARRESEAVVRAVTAAYKRGFSHGYDAAFFAASDFPISDLARVNDESEDAARARIQRGAEAFVAFEEGRPRIMDIDSMAEALGGLLFETVDIARSKLTEAVAKEKARLGEPRRVAPASTNASASEPARCVQCGVKLPPAPETGGRPRRYCSARCRKAHWQSGL